jgi:hypothetical protein
VSPAFGEIMQRRATARSSLRGRLEPDGHLRRKRDPA